MSKTLRYVGGHADVVVPLPDGTADVYVARGKTAVFTDDVADGLLEQESNWKLVPPTKPKAKPTAASKTKTAAAAPAASSNVS